jgi:glutamate formiminotransferase/formiminotetrahydrofolate cyclodeaminase
MVANLSAHKRGWDDRWEEFSRVAERGIALQNQLELLVDADTAAFNAIMEAYGMPKGTATQQQARHAAIQDATKNAIEIPMRVARLAADAMTIAEEMAAIGNPNSITDVGVGAMTIRTGVKGAILNARVNLQDLEDATFSEAVVAEADALWADIDAREARVLEWVAAVLGGAA